jgi:uncharacterized DUF497 family protein
MTATAHIARRGPTPEDCEQALADLLQVFLGGRWEGGESRQAIIGRTAKGRALVVVLTMRGNRFRIVIAWPANRRNQQAYREANQ